MTGFVQIIEARTSRAEEMMAFARSWRSDHDEMGPVRVTACLDRDRPGTVVSIVEFSSYETAMRNSEDPETDRFSRGMAEFCDEPPTFRNLDVQYQEVRMDAGRTSGSLTDA